MTKKIYVVVEIDYGCCDGFVLGCFFDKEKAEQEKERRIQSNIKYEGNLFDEIRIEETTVEY